MAVALQMNDWFDHSTALLSPQDGEHRTSNPEAKKHAACDECRKRKLKCSGEQTGCSRCLKQSLQCHYSIQKPMGRPRKRRQISEDEDEMQTLTPDTSTGKESMTLFDSSIPDLAIDPGMQPHAHNTFNFQSPSTHLNHYTATTGSMLHSECELQPTQSSTPLNLVQPLEPMKDVNGHPMDSPSAYKPPSCTCLSYIYLSLSTLSSLPQFPTSASTLSTLHTAARTAKSAIDCPQCPLEFATSMQNVMLLGTLFNVIGDGWLKVTRSSSRDLGIHCAPESYTTLMPHDPIEQQEFWKRWHRHVIRRGVIGGQYDPAMYTPDFQCEETPDLLSLIKRIEDRQKRWHEMGLSRLSSDGGVKKCEKLHPHRKGHVVGEDQVEKRDFLCLRIVGSARELLERFDFRPEDYLDYDISR
ncbi:hypothetical protein FQN54_002151 [Arachnomyces sp. PD_36]|nr:hypothetical protein FQN54_002151 [Arachnomyces sp. PD_36]